MSERFADLLERIRTKTAIVGIIGLGYVGLPLARAFSAKGFRVLGFDVDSSKITRLNAGESYIKQFPNTIIETMREQGFEATDNFERLREADAVLICVPTPLTDSREPDLSYVVNSGQSIAAALRPGQLIVLESTTYPTTTRKVLLPQLEATGLVAGQDFFVAFSPEREDPGNVTHSVTNIPKVVGGIDEASTELAANLYSSAVVNVVRVSSPEIAEACKILENTYRCINIALVNELKMLYDRMGIDVWEVIDAAKTKPFGFQAFYPGPGLGGHCIPIDPFYLSWVARQYGMTTRFIELAGEVNTAMPTYVINRLAEALNDRCKPVKGSKVAILGMAYKKDVDDPRESPGFELMDLLLKKGAIVSYNDPHIPTLPRMRHYPHLAMDSQPLTADWLAEQDAVLIATDHTAYDYNWIVANAGLVIDTRNATKNITVPRDQIVRA
ncbi:nucleotide sugar dehydrogenase [Tuwongella immobilis]|uniref:UDP-glucose/GDP-mannose dehydrogenase C-terminal domain-containing protein n=1 Tax=Tuwongella immobilis TaxID=692036 RepID=A0A6C2YHJ4_9BACT|nr:nucleotide sugar dehydrogenase [Tuwongella immobilis]VIP00721.1 udp-n-acetyl-d-glucosamine dehydrogenase : Nucleotide sugar dehydrogenase OS=Planctomyces limnophilus (strain ATCC 43296 / DSM 3776 / IFAM 1008 / 290) GN=Plim_4103 PE=3 SV=1: UDPG_MGDP_dh_N: UDPG_MGDP_dh: UDPG_MGDP_dh_C [Tuwongella immobilis]VTR96860.1 udp-n-acetyl-d-glucosamine dehydrogenase : Nucleotide sugar dehydrogenase OS=Planctomyces limnophilus (strain ATCC 43296 / DSM 3776 / IFAM 1008 / 290) GN=Plim_4103 PE=3 SV=1: UDPG_M